MTHGVDPRTGEKCAAQWTTVRSNGFQARAVAGCVCGWAEFHGIDVESVEDDLALEGVDRD